MLDLYYVRPRYAICLVRYATLLYTAYQCVTRSKRHLLCNSIIVLYGTVVEMYRR